MSIAARKRKELLTKLAMELAEWPKYPISSELPELPLGLVWGSPFREAEWAVYCDIGAWIKRADWLAERERLISKPGWDRAPAGSNVRCQDDDGYWHFGYCPDAGCPYVTPRGTWESGPNGKWLTGVSRLKGRLPAGHDWRTTLEARPQEQSAESRLHDDALARDAEAASAADFLRACLKYMEGRASSYDKLAMELAEWPKHASPQEQSAESRLHDDTLARDAEALQAKDLDLNAAFDFSSMTNEELRDAISDMVHNLELVKDPSGRMVSPGDDVRDMLKDHLDSLLAIQLLRACGTTMPELDEIPDGVSATPSAGPAAKMVRPMKCKHNDCGWCYAPDNAATNDKQGQCLEPKQCPELQRQVHEHAETCQDRDD